MCVVVGIIQPRKCTTFYTHRIVWIKIFVFLLINNSSDG